MRSNPKARQAKSRARLQRYEELAAEAEKARRLDTEEIQIPPGPRLGSIVIEAAGLTKGFEDRLLIRDVSFSLPRGGIVGIIGPNGVGKTTLFKMIIGREHPDAGALTIGPTVQISYVDQAPRRARPVPDSVADRLRRPGPHQGRQRGGAFAGVRGRVRVQGARPAKARRRAVRR